MQFSPECALFSLCLLRRRRFPQANAERRGNRRCCGGQRDEILTLTRHEARAGGARERRALEAHANDRERNWRSERLRPLLGSAGTFAFSGLFWIDDDGGSGSCLWESSLEVVPSSRTTAAGDSRRKERSAMAAPSRRGRCVYKPSLSTQQQQPPPPT